MKILPFLIMSQSSPAAITKAEAEALYDRIRAKIEHEDNLVNQRIMWMITLQGLLFTAYGFSLSAEASSLSFANTNPDAYHVFKANLTTLRTAMTYTGISASVAALMGVVAANRAIRDDENQIQSQTNLPPTVLKKPIGQRATNRLGMTCSLLMPILGGIAWAWIGGLLPSPFLVLAAAILSFFVFLITWALR